jgi:hypothetical protein
MSLPPSQPEGPGASSPEISPAWPSRIPWGGFVALAGSLVYFFFFYFRLPLSESDEGILAAGAERILRGQVPYRDFFSELAPASFYFQAWIFRILGANVTALRLTAWIVGGILSLLIYLLARRLLRGTDAFLPPLIFTLICYPYTYRVSHHSWGNVFLYLSVLCLSQLALRPPTAKPLLLRLYVFAAGLSAAVCLLCMQPKGAWALAMGIIFLSLSEGLPGGISLRAGLRKGMGWTLWFILGAGFVLALAVLYFASRGALGYWVEDNLVFLFTSYRPYLDVPQASPASIISHMLLLTIREPSTHLALYVIGYLFFLLVAPGIAFGHAFWRVFIGRSPAEPRTRLWLLFLLEGLGSYFSEMHSPDDFHLMTAAPIMLILFVDTCRCALSASWPWSRPRRAVAWLGLALMCFTGLRKAANTSVINTPIETRRGTIYVQAGVAREFQQVVDLIQEMVPAGGETFFLPYHAELYFLTSTRNPTRYDVLLDDFHSVQQIGEAISTLQAKKPAHIFDLSRRLPWSIRPHFPDDTPDALGPHRVEEVLLDPGTEYVRAREVAGMQVWVLKR